MNPPSIQSAITELLSAHLALSEAANTLADAMAYDLEFRNRPERQRLTSALCLALPKRIDVGILVDAISDAQVGKPLSAPARALLSRMP